MVWDIDSAEEPPRVVRVPTEIGKGKGRWDVRWLWTEAEERPVLMVGDAGGFILGFLGEGGVGRDVNECGEDDIVSRSAVNGVVDGESESLFDEGNSMDFSRYTGPFQGEGDDETHERPLSGPTLELLDDTFYFRRGGVS